MVRSRGQRTTRSYQDAGCGPRRGPGGGQGAVDGGAADAVAGDEVGDGLAAVAQGPDLSGLGGGQPGWSSGVPSAEPRSRGLVLAPLAR